MLGPGDAAVSVAPDSPLGQARVRGKTLQSHQGTPAAGAAVPVCSRGPCCMWAVVPGSPKWGLRKDVAKGGRSQAQGPPQSPLWVRAGWARARSGRHERSAPWQASRPTVLLNAGDLVLLRDRGLRQVHLLCTPVGPKGPFLVGVFGSEAPRLVLVNVRGAVPEVSLSHTHTYTHAHTHPVTQTRALALCHLLLPGGPRCHLLVPNGAVATLQGSTEVDASRREGPRPWSPFQAADQDVNSAVRGPSRWRCCTWKGLEQTRLST